MKLLDLLPKIAFLNHQLHVNGLITFMKTQKSHRFYTHFQYISIIRYAKH